MSLINNIKERSKLNSERKHKEHFSPIKLDYFSVIPSLEDIKLLDIIDLDEIQTIQDTFAKTNGVASLITDINGKPITRPSNFCKACQIVRSTKIGKKRCEISNMILGERAKELNVPVSEKCQSLGLIEGGVPITINGKHVAYWLIGQINTNNIDQGSIKDFAKEIGADPYEMLDAYHDVHAVSRDKFENILQLLMLISRQIATMGHNNLKLIQEMDERKKNEERFKAIFESANDGIYVTDLKSNFLDANHVGYEQLGYTKSELQRMSPRDVFVLASPAQIVKRIKELVLKGHVVFETILGRKDGSTFPSEVSLQIFNYRGQKAILGISRDITERRQAEHALRESEEKFKAIFENANDGIFLVSLDGKLIDGNHVSYEQLGYSKNEVLQMDLEDIFHFADSTQIKNGITQVVQKKHVVFETVLSRKDGSTIPVELNLRMFDNQGQKAILGVSRDITERKQVEKKLYESEKKYSKLVENGNDGIVILQDNVYKYANKRMADITGYSIEETIGRPFTDYISPKYTRNVMEMYKRRINGEKVPNCYEIEIVCKDGKIIPMEISASTIEYGGRPADMAILRDLTERKEAERKLYESEKKYSTLVESGNDGILIVQDNIFKYVNKKTKELFGYSADEVIGKKFTDFIAPEYRYIVAERHKKRICDENAPNCYEIAFISKDGKTFPIELNASYIDFEGKPAVMAIIRDIKERKQAEQKIHLDEARLEALLELNQMEHVSSNEILNFTRDKAVELTDSKIGFIGFVNNNETTFTIDSWSENIINECKLTDKQNSYSVKESRILGEAIRQRNTVLINEYQNTDLPKKDILKDHIKITRFLSVPIFFKDEIVAFVAVANKSDEYDYSDIRQLTLLLEGMWKKLQSRKERKELLQSKIDAEIANRSKSEFLAIVSHELKTPLNSIIGFSELLLEGMFQDLNEKQERPMCNILNSGNDLLKIVNDILDMSRIESNDIDFCRETVPIQDLIDEMKIVLLPLALKRNIKLGIYMEPQLQYINIDRIKFKQILYNLGNNAIKFTPEKGSVTFTGKQIGNTIQMCVEDTGIGIPEENLEEIFIPFKQAHSHLTRKYGGTGLGLAIAKHLVELHNGNIRIESEVNKGTKVIVSIPMD